MFLLPRPRDFPSELRRNLSESESLIGVDGLWIVLYSVVGKKEHFNPSVQSSKCSTYLLTLVLTKIFTYKTISGNIDS